MLTHRRGLLRTLVATLLLAALAAAAWIMHRQAQQEQMQQDALATALPQAVRLHIPRGTSLAGIAQLAADVMPVEAAMFRTLVRRQQAAAALQAGVYEFSAGTTLAEVIGALAAGKVAVAKVTLIEGRTFAAWQRQLAEEPRLRQTLPTLDAAALRATLGITLAHLEGMFLPDTYFFNHGDSDVSILRRAHMQLNRTLDALWQTRQDGGLFRNPYEALILASIVEKETGKAAERPLIAAVFMNRLRRGMRLQADPTVIYGLGDAFDGNLTRAHLRRQNTPYNTYMNAGLPPTPIANASAAAIRAVLNPAQSDYLYFVAKGDGSHHFSRTLREHNNAVNRYQRKRK